MTWCSFKEVKTRDAQKIFGGLESRVTITVTFETRPKVGNLRDRHNVATWTPPITVQQDTKSLEQAAIPPKSMGYCATHVARISG